MPTPEQPAAQPGHAVAWLGASAAGRRDAVAARLARIPEPPAAAQASADLSPGLSGREVRVVPYQEDWPARYEAEAAELTRLFARSGLDVAIEHVGSTAIPGLVAKPIIDIALGVHNVDAVGPLLQCLIAAGRSYLKAGNQPGMLLAGKGDPRTVLYHLVVLGTPAWDRLVLVRQQLRRHPGLAEEYGRQKLEAAARHPRSRLAYGAEKSEIVRAILNRGHLERRRTAAAHAGERQRAALDQQVRLLEFGYRGATRTPEPPPPPHVDYPTW